MQLTAQAVSVRFGGLVAVDQVSISLQRGEILNELLVVGQGRILGELFRNG